MISVIISKYHPSLVEQLSQNIEATIGVPFEIIIIENSQGKMGLCEVYNKGAQKARFDILCFSHEDVEIQTMNWGSIICDLFHQHKNLGLVGVAGSAYKPRSPSGWWYEDAHTDVLLTHYIQSDKSGNKAELVSHQAGKKDLAEVVCVDGFWFCTPGNVALSLRFDDNLFKGFHCYDIDYSLRVFQQYKVCVSFNVLIKHCSEGNQNRAWVLDTLKLTGKWQSSLPAQSTVINELSGRKEEMAAYYYFLKEMIFLGFPVTKVFTLPWSRSARNLIGIKGVIELLLKLTFNVYLKVNFSLLNKFRR